MIKPDFCSSNNFSGNLYLADVLIKIELWDDFCIRIICVTDQKLSNYFIAWELPKTMQC